MPGLGGSSSSCLQNITSCNLLQEQPLGQGNPEHKYRFWGEWTFPREKDLGVLVGEGLPMTQQCALPAQGTPHVLDPPSAALGAEGGSRIKTEKAGTLNMGQRSRTGKTRDKDCRTGKMGMGWNHYANMQGFVKYHKYRKFLERKAKYLIYLFT